MGQELGEEGLLDAVHTNMYIYSFSALCGFCMYACASHAMIHNQVHSVCSACVTHMYYNRSAMTFNLFSRFYLHCSTKCLLEH